MYSGHVQQWVLHHEYMYAVFRWYIHDGQYVSDTFNVIFNFPREMKLVAAQPWSTCMLDSRDV